MTTTLISLIEANEAADFQTVFKQKMSAKVRDALAECRVYIASRMFEAVDTGGQYTTGADDPKIAHQVRQDVHDYARNLPKQARTDAERRDTARTLQSDYKIKYRYDRQDENGNTVHELKYQGEPDTKYRQVENEEDVADSAKQMHQAKQQQSQPK